MATEIHMRKKDGALVPDSPEDEALMEEIPIDKPLKVAVRRDRSGPHHRWFFSLMRLVHHNMPENEYIKSLDDLRNAVMVAVGEFDMKTRRMPSGNWVKVPEPRSLRWDKMDEIEFRRVSEKILDFICQRIVPGLNRADLERELDERLR